MQLRQLNIQMQQECGVRNQTSNYTKYSHAGGDYDIKLKRQIHGIASFIKCLMRNHIFCLEAVLENLFKTNLTKKALTNTEIHLTNGECSIAVRNDIGLLFPNMMLQLNGSFLI